MVIRFVFGFLFLIFALSDAFALDVRVESPNGAPRIVVDGKPVPARMFWGAPGSSAYRLSPEAKRITFEFTASGDATTGTMHFRFGQSAGQVHLTDITVTDLTAGKPLIGGFAAKDWTHWPTDATNTTGSYTINTDTAGGELAATLKSPSGDTWPDFHVYHQPNLNIVKGHRYRVSLTARAEPARSLTIAFYRPGQAFTYLGGPDTCFPVQIKLAADAGVNFVSFPVALPWPEPGQAVDYSASDSECETVLQANPNALLIPRIGMDPPAWWRQKHPDDQMQWEDGRRDSFVPASPQYRHDAAQQLAAVIAHLEEKFGDHIAGYHPAGQNTGEWFYQDTWKQPLSGYAPADLAAWRLWLRERYATDDQLQKAWHDPAASVESATVPAPQQRRAAPAGILRDPATQQPVIDFALFQQDAMADCVTTLAHAARTASRGRKLVLFFYGYGFEFGMCSNGPSISGHYALRKALACPDIDILCSPISYSDRGLGQSAPAMSAAESVALAGKMWLNEDDTHTYLATERFPGFEAHVTTVDATNQQLLRNVGQESLRNFGTWWMDLGASGWFNDARMWEQMKRLRALDDAMLATPRPFRPEVAAVLDEASMAYVAPGGQAVTMPGIYEVRRALGRMGTPYGQYLLDDVIAGKVKARLYVMLNAWRLSAAQRQDLLATTRGATVIWCYAPGYLTDNGDSLAAIKQLTGFAIQSVSPPKAWATIADDRLHASFGAQRAIAPLFAVADAKGNEILATYSDRSPAIAIRRNDNRTSIFVGVPGLSSDLLRLAARTAGVHLFTDTDCNVYANGPYLILHGSQDGPLNIDTGRDGGITDLLSGEKLASGPRLTLPLVKGQTRVLKY